MALGYTVNGETQISYDGNVLGLAESPVQVVITPKYKDIIVDAWGPSVPPEVQYFLAEARISFTLVYFDNVVVNSIWTNMMGGALPNGTIGQTSRAGTLMSPYMKTLSLSSPVLGRPWTFNNVYAETSGTYPLGTEKTLLSMSFRALPIPATGNPYGGGTGAQGTVLWSFS